MTARFHSRVQPDEVEITCVEKRLIGSKPVPRSDWWIAGADRTTIRTLTSLVDRGIARGTTTSVLVPSGAAAALPSSVAEAIGLPALTTVSLSVGLDGRVESPDGHLRLRWTDREGRQIYPDRRGIVLNDGARSGRLTAALFDIVLASDTYNATIGMSSEVRISAWMPMQRALAAVSADEVTRDGYLSTFTIFQAGAFALDVHEDESFAPRLMSRSAAPSLEDDAPTDDLEEGSEVRQTVASPLLTPEDERGFIEAFNGSDAPKSAYRTGSNRYVLIDPVLKVALGVVKEQQRAGAAERRAFLRNPRAYLAEALERRGDDTSSATLFVETAGYSDRVAGLGLWEKPVIPWLTRPPNGWLPESGWTLDGEEVEPPPLSRTELDAAERAYEAAEARGEPTVTIRNVPIPIDQVPAVLEAERQRTQRAFADEVTYEAAAERDPPVPRLVLVIEKTNFEGADYVLALAPRLSPLPDEPPAHRMGPDPLKLHQLEGFRWLVDAWRAGWPGVLLADDMGLGKTFQALSFMAWLHEHHLRSAHEGPMLVVAPTALLRNWEKEAADRLAPDALGGLVRAYGSGLRNLRLDPHRRVDDGETLDRAELRNADWILTTYETLTDHERAFAPIEYSLILFDEMQKVKAPDTLNTKAAKAMNARFVIGMTGTPIENRMEDLWCIFDRITPGYLGDLKGFSAQYSEAHADNLRVLKEKLDNPVKGDGSHVKAPPVMKRRMKVDILEGLPTKIEVPYLDNMPPEQASAYRQIVTEALRHRERSQGYMLKVLHGMRGVSLHPDDATHADVSTASRFEAFAKRSARLTRMIAVLRDIAAQGEKALIFVEFLGMQHAVAEGVAALFGLHHRLDVINGSVPGERRLGIVERFSSREPGFDALVLSPRAAGVGLNITAANHVIHLSRWWNPAVEDQCNDRAYRIGQTKPVTIHIPIATHPDIPDGSFDQRLASLLQRKRQLSREMLVPPTSDSDVSELFGATVRD